MSLRIWLPLMNNTNNYGEDGVATSGTITYGSGKLGQYAINKGNVYIPAEVSNSIFNITTGFTIAFWVWKDASSGSEMLFGNDSTAAIPANRKLALHCYSDNTSLAPHRNSLHTWGLMSDTSTSVNGYFTVRNVLPDNTWTHVTLCLDPKAAKNKLYINGVLTASPTVNLSGTFTFNYNMPLFNLTSTTKIQDYRIYDECLSQTEISRIAEGLIADYKFNNNGMGRVNLLPINSLPQGGNSSKNYDAATDTYTFVAPTTANASWGAATALPNISVPWGFGYVFSCEIYHEYGSSVAIKIDYNNSCTNCSGNDNDSGRLRQDFTIPTNSWTTILFGSSNTNTTKNPSKSALLVYDGIGFRSNGFPAATTWKIRKAKFELVVKPSEVSSVDYAPYCSPDTDIIVSNTVVDLNMINSGVKCMTDYTSPVGDISGIFTGNEYCESKKNVNTFLPVDQITVNWWGYLDDWLTYRKVMSCTENGGFTFEVANTSQLSFTVYRAGVGYLRAAGTGSALSTISPGWHMITGTYDGYQAKLYIDSQLVATVAAYSTYANISYPGVKLYLGGEATLTGIDQPLFIGRLAEVKIYATALSAETILNKYKVKQKSLSNGKLIGGISEYNSRDYALLKNPTSVVNHNGTYKVEQLVENNRPYSKITCLIAGTGNYCANIIPSTTDETYLVNGKQYILKFLARSANKEALTFNYERGNYQVQMADKSLRPTWKEFWLIFKFNATSTYSAFTLYGGWAVDEYVDIANMRVYDYDATENLKFNKNKVIQCTDLIEELATNLKLTKQNTVITSEFIED